jgi:alpha-2-macroglobulin
VRGVTSDTKVGSAVQRVIVRKNLMVRLAVPRFFRQGDEVTVSAIVHNYLEDTKTVKVSLDVTGLDVLQGATTDITVPSKGEAKVDWRVKAQNVRGASLVTKALTNEESDAMELDLPVVPFGVKMADSKSGSVASASGQQDAAITFPAGTELSSHSLDLSVTPSVAGTIFGALDYLTSYPYGCTEQTMSSFLPNIVVAKAAQDLGLKATINQADLKQKIRAGMDRLYDFQHEDGGWGWWKDDESAVFMTAYVVSGLSQAQAAGYDVKDGVISRGQEWLKGSLKKHPNMRIELRAYVAYALAQSGSKDADLLNTIWDHRAKGSAQALALTGLTLQMAGDSRASIVADELENQAKSSDVEAWWEGTYDYLMEFEIDDSPETTAYAIKLLSLVKPQSPLLPKAAFWLATHRDDGYFWYSTKQTAMVIFGLTDYLKASHELNADFTVEVSLNDKTVLTRKFTAADTTSAAAPAIHLTFDQLAPGENKIHVRKTGQGRLYWSARGEYYSTEKKDIQSNRIALSITRDYFRLTPQTENDRIVYKLDPLTGALQPGDVIAVKLNIGGSDWRYLLIEDPIPAGMEFIERDDLYEIKDRPGWWEYWFSRREFHDDRAAFFQTYFSGRHDYFYLLKVVEPGKFRVSPALVQPMYQPSIISTTDTTQVEVK